MINVSRVVRSRMFKPKAFTVTRKTGEWVKGRFTTEAETVEMTGTVNPMETEDVAKLPNGDQISGAILTHSIEPIFTTKLTIESGPSGNLSDEVNWMGERWQVQSVSNRSEYGFYKAIAVRMKGA